MLRVVSSRELGRVTVPTQRGLVTCGTVVVNICRFIVLTVDAGYWSASLCDRFVFV
jgi:hypothetical protein